MNAQAISATLLAALLGALLGWWTASPTATPSSAQPARAELVTARPLPSRPATSAESPRPPCPPAEPDPRIEALAAEIKDLYATEAELGIVRGEWPDVHPAATPDGARAYLRRHLPPGSDILAEDCSSYPCMFVVPDVREQPLDGVREEDDLVQGLMLLHSGPSRERYYIVLIKDQGHVPDTFQTNARVSTLNREYLGYF